jgi:hypothetical protein
MDSIHPISFWQKKDPIAHPIEFLFCTRQAVDHFAQLTGNVCHYW